MKHPKTAADSAHDRRVVTATNDGVEGDLPNISRRSAVTYLAVAAGFAAGGILMPRSASALAGRCYKCNCCLFEGTENNCSNCGHKYSDHTGQTCDKPDTLKKL